MTSNFIPDTTPEAKEAAKKTIGDYLNQIDEIIKQNEYDGPYKSDFAKLSVDLATIIAAISNAAKDGIQLSDLQSVLLEVAPLVVKIGKTVYSFHANADKEDIYSDLIMFIYYEIEKRVNTHGLIKFGMRLLLKLYLANKLAKYFIMAVDYVENKAMLAIDKMPKFLQDLIINLK